MCNHSVHNFQLADSKSDVQIYAICRFWEKQYKEDWDRENDISKLGFVKCNMQKIGILCFGPTVSYGFFKDSLKQFRALMNVKENYHLR